MIDNAKVLVNITLAEKRLSLLYNTLGKAGWVNKSPLSEDLTASLVVPTNGAPFQVPAAGKLLTTTSTIVFKKDPIYALNIPWIVLYFTSVTIMFAASIFLLILHYACYAPPIWDSSAV
jgi:hypothetical protein